MSVVGGGYEDGSVASRLASPATKRGSPRINGVQNELGGLKYPMFPNKHSSGHRKGWDITGSKIL